MTETPQQKTVEPSSPRRRRLLGCAVALAVVLVILLVAWWVVSRHLGDVLAGVVRDQAGEAINGRLEFTRLEVDLVGRAVLTDAAIFPTNATEAVITCPRTVVAFDLLNFIGPNRGRRAVTVTLQEPRVSLVREPDGGFNLAHLARDSGTESEPIGVALHLKNATVDFTDWCLLDQNYPRLPEVSGLAGQLLDELGYDALGAPELQAHHEVLKISGNVLVNPEREELTLSVKIDREAPGGTVTAKGAASLDGARFDLRTTLTGIDLASLTAYVQALFPHLDTGTPEDILSGKVPALAGSLSSGNVHLSKRPEQPVKLDGEIQLAGVRFKSRTLPELNLSRLSADFDTDGGQLNAGLDLTAAGVQLDGRAGLNLNDDDLTGKLSVSLVDAAALAGWLELPELELTGGLSAQIGLSGTSAAPEITAELSSDRLKYRQLALGRLDGTVQYTGTRLMLDDVQFAGGDLPLAVTGNFNISSRSGTGEIAAGPLTCSAALELAAKLLPDQDLPELDAAGSFHATAAVMVTAGTPTTTLHLWSDRLTISGQRLDSVDLRSTIKAPNLKIDSAEAVLVAEPISLAGFTSDGALRVKLRGGGSISTLPGQEQAVVAIVGEGETLNLAPAQGRLSFKVIGPADDPEIRLQLKTTHAKQPLVLSATTHYRQGFAPLSASLNWQETTADFSGRIDLAGQRVEGALTADSVNLRRFSGNPDLSGILSVTAEVGGTFSAPTVTGSVTIPTVSYAWSRRTISFMDAAADFELIEGSRIRIANGRFGFDDNHFTVAGELGAAQSSLLLRCNDFNLFSVLAMTREEPAFGTKQAYLHPPLEIKSSGPLQINLTGELTDPKGTIAYTSGAGSVRGHAFNSAELLADFDLNGAKIQRFIVTSPSGKISADGQFQLEPRRYSITSSIDEFDVGVLTSLTENPLAGGLTGSLNGRLHLSGDEDGYSVNGTLRLAGGSFQGVAITVASAEIHTEGSKLLVRNGNIVAAGTILTAFGSIDPAAANPLASASFTVDATSVDLALLQPFLGPEFPVLAGLMACKLNLTPGTGRYSDASFTAHNTGGPVHLGDADLDSIHLTVYTSNDRLALQRCDISTSSSTLSANGKLDLGQLKAGKTVPLDLTLNCRDFNIGEIKPLLPITYQALLPSGVLSCRDIRLTGNTGNPLISGGIDFDLTDMPAEFDMLARATGGVEFTENDIDVSGIVLTPATASSGITGTAVLRGSGRLGLVPFRLLSGQLTVELGSEGRYMYVDTTESGSDLLSTINFAGHIGGNLQLAAGHDRSGNQRLKISGTVNVNKAGEISRITVYQKEQEALESDPAPFIFDPQLAVKIESGTSLHYKPMDIRGQFVGDLRTNLFSKEIRFTGVPGNNNAGDQDAFKVSGTIQLPGGSVKVYRHVVRLEGDGNQLRFLGVPGALLPVFDGQGSLTLRNILTNSPAVTNGGMEMGQQSPANGSRDLKILFTFTQFKLDMEEGQDVGSPGSLSSLNGTTPGLRITSEPPLPQDQIIAYLLGGAQNVISGQTGLGDFAQGELVAYGTSFISREIEEIFDLAAFQFGGIGDDDNPFYVDMEKQLTPDFTVTYYRDYFSSNAQNEEFGVKYRLLEQRQGNRYQNLGLEVNFQNDAFAGSGGEFMFTWTTSF